MKGRDFLVVIIAFCLAVGILGEGLFCEPWLHYAYGLLGLFALSYLLIVTKEKK